MRDFVRLHLREILNILMTFGGLLLVLAIACFAPRLGNRWFSRAQRQLARIASRPWRAILLVAGFSLALCILTFVVAGTPIPRVHDEFSYLLAADTFAHWRLTNAPLPDDIWPFFETMHELMRPTYASKFGPAQGLTLAIGQILTGQAFVGVWLSTVLGCAAVTWALQGWVRPRWALLGGLLTAIHPQVVYWSHVYWGGTVGMLGGALIFGAIPRIINRCKATEAMLLVIGLAILANSRPYEGILWLIAVVGTIVGARLLNVQRSTFNVQRSIKKCALAAVAVGVPILGWMGYYNWRVTGNALELPYQLHTKTYMSVPLFYWNKPPPPKTYRHEVLRHHHDVYERWYFERAKTIRGWLWYFGANVYKFFEQFLLRDLPLMAGFLVLPWATRRDPRARFAIAYLLLFAVGWAIIPWFEQHYVGPLIAVIVFLGIRGMRWIGAWRWRGGAGRAFVRWCVVSCFIVLIPTLMREYRNNHGTGWWVLRSQMQSKLEREGGRHLVIVRYGPEHISGNEWVFNSADLKHAPVIWAREMGASEMPKLLDYFNDRHVWLLDVRRDYEPPTLMPYP